MKSSKALMVLLVVVVAIAATPLGAQFLAGTWKGTGDGACIPPFPTPVPDSMFPWQNWVGEIPDSETVMTGTWHDVSGYTGNFSGDIILAGPLYAICNGMWLVLNPFVTPPSQTVGGSFTMRLYYGTQTCEGEWYSVGGTYSGTMEGEKD